MRWLDLGRTGVTLAVATAVLSLVAGCTVGPNYVRPTVVAPDAYKELAGWKVARPQDDLPHGAWWGIVGDPKLNAIEAQVSIKNQNLAVAEAQFRRARALVREAWAAYFPTVTVGVGYTRSHPSLRAALGRRPQGPGRITAPGYAGRATVRSARPARC